MLSSLSISSASTYAHIQPRDQGQLSDKNSSQKHTHTHALVHTHTHTRVDLFEVAVFPLLPVHHVMENRDHDVSDLGLGHQGDAQEGTHHSGDEVRLVVALSQTDRCLV